MRLAILSESPADEACARILVESLAVTEIEWQAPPFRYPPQGWTTVTKNILPVLRWLHHNHGDGLVIIVDSDNSTVHMPDHDQSPDNYPGCRKCVLRGLIGREQTRLQDQYSRRPVRIAMGLAVPSREAWLLFGKDPDVGEAGWVQALESGKSRYDRATLKRQVYGSSKSTVSMMIDRGLEETRRILQNLDDLVKWFPNFAEFADEVRALDS